MSDLTLNVLDAPPEILTISIFFGLTVPSSPLSLHRCQPSGDEVLFVRPDAVWDKSKPISGGIPICFPRFGPSPEMQQHGFARNVDWVVCSSSADPNPDDPEPSVMFKLKDNDYTREMWDVGFEATYEVTLRRDKLKIEFCVRNPPGAEKPIDFTAAVHLSLIHI